MRLAKRVEQLEMSPTVSVMLEAQRLRAEGKEVIDFGAGEPDFDTPLSAQESAHQAIRDNLSHYTATAGLAALREALAGRYERDYPLQVAPEQIFISAGGKMVLYTLMQALVGPGDKVLLASPYWVTFPEQVKLAGGVPEIVPAREEDDFVPQAADFVRAVDSRTRVLILNSPVNPTGAVIPGAEIERFVELCRKHDLTLVFDECYEKFVYPPARHETPAVLADRLGDRLVVVGSCSKTFAMTGWRVGYALATPSLVRALNKLQSHTVTHASNVAQAAAIAAIAAEKESVPAMLREYEKRRAVMLDGLRRLPGVSCREPQGAFYTFPNVTGLYERLKVKDSVGVARQFLDKALVSVVPGEAFGAPGHLRFSYALAQDSLALGLRRLEELLA
ncbi:MAG: pyridoxal phosphate-dependent aminotransferase [Acidobacteria bacterium]|nr:pyridoxal phosphate-dependent aminotransferase [Acidobacteriota bacterium]